MSFETTQADIRFRDQMKSGEFPLSEFDHRAHLRLAYIYLAGTSIERATQLMRDTLRRYLARNGVDPQKFHETLTQAWILAVRHFMSRTAASGSSDEFIEKNPEMLDTRIMLTHYSAEVLFSDEARTAFVQPDLDPIPRHGN